MPNRLADAVSPYLLAHSGNPVDWHPWSEEAFAEAKERDVPVFVSIGYATCHWCHVMARESFSDERLAARLNAEFVPVKVDREEHPDVDAAYLAAASAFTRNLGWPLSVFATPEGRAFFAGTYFPPEARGGMPSFGQILDAVTDAWTHRRDSVAETAGRVAAAIESLAVDARSTSGSSAAEDALRVTAAAEALAAAEDPQFGGFGAAPGFDGPKFPAVPALGFLLSSGVQAAEDAAVHTLAAMADSALRDGVDGGFFRYGTARDWSSPHYERMLYDNAGLLRLYTDAAVPAGHAPARPESARFVRVAEGVADFLIGTMRVEGGFASAQDSESEIDGVRVEGEYYRLDAAARAAQPRPALDAKVLTGWNGLAIGALAHAGSLLARPDWVAVAAAVADGLLERHFDPESGLLIRASLNGRASAATASLEDYGLFARGLLDTFLATGEPRFALAARRLVDACLRASGSGGVPGSPFGLPGGGDPVLSAHGLVWDADPSEGAYPSGLSALADASRVLYALTDDARYEDAARRVASSFSGSAARSPIAFGGMLQMTSALAAGLQQFVVVTPDPATRAGGPTAGAPGDATRAATSVRARSLGEWAVGVAVSQGAASALADAGFGLFQARTAMRGGPTEYVCLSFVCELPRPFAG